MTDRSNPGLVAARKQRLAAQLDGAFDAWLAGSPANVDHATGYRSVAYELFRQHQLAALVAGDRRWLVCPVADSAPAMDAGVSGDELVCFGRFYYESRGATQPPTDLVDEHGSLAEAVAAACRRAGLERGRIGVDVAGLGASWPAIEAALPDGLEVVDAGSWSLAVRSHKLDQELELLTHAARLAEDGITAAIETAKVGMTERQLAQVVARTMVEGGGTPRFVVVTAGERSALSDAAPTDRPLGPGELLRFDVGCTVDGYWSDIGRTAVVGPPDAEQRARYDAILAGEQAQLDRARPGMSARELFDLAVRTVEANGLAPYRRQHCGHGIGSEVYEPPIVAPAYDTELEPGMTFCFETPFYELGWGGMMVEDTLVVTDDGVRRLNRSTRELRVVDA